jgi:hypothetical protein
MCSPLIADLIMVFGFRVGDLAMVFREWQHIRPWCLGVLAKLLAKCKTMSKAL